MVAGGRLGWWRGVWARARLRFRRAHELRPTGRCSKVVWNRLRVWRARAAGVATPATPEPPLAAVFLPAARPAWAVLPRWPRGRHVVSPHGHLELVRCHGVGLDTIRCRVAPAWSRELAAAAAPAGGHSRLERWIGVTVRMRHRPLVVCWAALPGLELQVQVHGGVVGWARLWGGLEVLLDSRSVATPARPAGAP